MRVAVGRVAFAALVPRGRREASGDTASSGERGQALIETALVLPVLLLLAFGVVAVGRVTSAQMGVSAVAREAARSAALARDPTDAWNQAQSRGQAVASGYRLTNGSLQLAVNLGTFDRGDEVSASARYVVTLDDLPLLGWVEVPVTSTHAERIDLYRSRQPAGG